MSCYKASMFNRILKKNERMVIFNSKTGPYGIKRVDYKHQKLVENYLLNPDSGSMQDELYGKLIEYGFLVPKEIDEKQIREYYQTLALTNSLLRLVIHTSRDCNFRCTYCYMDFKDETIYNETKQGVVNFILKNIQHYKSIHISWFGGEPLLGIDAIKEISEKVIDICGKAKKPYSASITTNGYLLTPENIDILIRAKVTSFFITIDGIKQQHDMQRVLENGKGTFDTIINNLIYIRDHIKTRALNIAIRSNMTKQHIENLADYYSFYDKCFGEDSRFTLYAKAVGDYGGARVKRIQPSMLKGMDTIYDMLSQLNGKIKFMWNINDLAIGSSCCPSREYNKFTIGCDGSVHKCDEDLQGFSVGQLYPDGRMEIYEAEYVKWIHIRRRVQCDNCFFSLICFMEGCPKSRIFHGDSICETNFEEVDSLIWWAAEATNAKYILPE